MDFEIVGPIRDTETIAAGRAILQLKRLRRRYGSGRWRKRKGRARVRLRDGTVGTKLTESDGGSSSSSSRFWTDEMKKQGRPRVRFAVCVKNKGYEASLEVGKLYRMLPDLNAARHGYLRIVDESGEDYGYSADRFFAIDLPKPLERALLRIAS